MIQGKLIEYGQDLTDVINVWNEVFSGADILSSNNWNSEISIYGLIYDDVCKPLAAGKLTFIENDYFLSDIGVIESQRNKGYGDFLVKLLINKAFLAGADSVYVNISEKFIEFFTKIGFKIFSKESSIQDSVSMIIFTSSVCRKCSKI